MPIRERLNQSGPRKLLALDGGGIRGMITVEILAKIESLLRERLQKKTLVLSDYFDYVAGTSTGAIIATCIAAGMPVSKIRDFYRESGKEMFDRASILKRLRYKYDDEPLTRKLRDVLRDELGTEETEDGGKREPTLGNQNLRTLLMVVLRNVTTDSPWPLSNNPDAKYNDRSRTDCNLNLPLWQIVRASTAAPTYFPPEVVTLGESEDAYSFIFVDGGVTPYNNPSFLVFLMATVKAYRLGWSAGEDQMLLVSVGTGIAPDADENLRPSQLHLLHSATSIPGALMFGANNQQDMLCRVFGKCLEGGQLDREIEGLMGAGSLIIGGESGGLPKHFTYMRYNCELTSSGLGELGLAHVDPGDVQQMDSVEHIDTLLEIGKAVGERQVKAHHFDGFLA